jgi:hypothetical protein
VCLSRSVLFLIKRFAMIYSTMSNANSDQDTYFLIVTG